MERFVQVEVYHRFRTAPFPATPPWNSPLLTRGRQGGKEVPRLHRCSGH